MEAVILAGGRGTRLRPVTDILPKPLIPLLGRPILEWQVGYLRAHGVRRVVVSAGYRAGQIADYAESRGGFGSSVSVEAEPSPLGTGGAIRRAARRVRGRSFLAMNGDVITDIDLARVAAEPDCVAAVPLRTKFGTMDLRGGAVAGFREKGEVAGAWMNAGVYHLTREAAGRLPARGAIEETLFQEYSARGRLRAAAFPGAAWFSVDSHRDVEECEAYLRAAGGKPIKRGARRAAA